MVVDYFDIAWAESPRRPGETYAPSIVDAKAVLSLAIPAQGFKTIAWQEHQSFQPVGGVKNSEPFFRLAPDGRPGFNIFAFVEFFDSLVFVANDHAAPLPDSL
jgi:hypothetical protein